MAGWRHPKDYRLITAAAPWPEQPTHLPSACREEKGGVGADGCCMYMYALGGKQKKIDRATRWQCG